MPDIHTPSIKTPCVGLCSTIYGDEICRGCKRTYLEVIDWNSYADSQKIEILDRLDALCAKITAQYFDITDEARIRATLKTLQIKHHTQHSAHTLLFTLLQSHYDKMDALEPYGAVLKTSSGYTDFKAAFEACDDALFAESEERFFKT